MKLFRAAIAALLISAAGMAAEHGCADKKSTRANGDLVQTAVKAGSFQTLVAAVKAAGLVETLQGPGPYTVFAPTDEAFRKIHSGTLRSLLRPENRGKLTRILTYHVVPGKLAAEDVIALNGAKTVLGERLHFSNGGGQVMVNDSRVLKTDVDATNGIIHVIDSVLMPSM